jgi:hypothetical protein
MDRIIPSLLVNIQAIMVIMKVMVRLRIILDTPHNPHMASQIIHDSHQYMVRDQFRDLDRTIILDSMAVITLHHHLRRVHQGGRAVA